MAITSTLWLSLLSTNSTLPNKEEFLHSPFLELRSLFGENHLFWSTTISLKMIKKELSRLPCLTKLLPTTQLSFVSLMKSSPTLSNYQPNSDEVPSFKASMNRLGLFHITTLELLHGGPMIILRALKGISNHLS